MKIFKINQKVLYVLSCILVTFFLYGCKEKDVDISVFNELPESPFLTQIKSSLENHVPLAIAFTAEWCPHCRQYKPVFNDLKDSYRDKVTFINIDVDDANGSPISTRFQVRGIPTTAFVRADGSVYKVQVGEITKEELIKIADELISNKKRGKGEPIAPFPIEIKKEEAAPQKEKKTEEAKPVEEVKPTEETLPPELPGIPEEGIPPFPPLDEKELPPLFPSLDESELTAPDGSEQDNNLDLKEHPPDLEVPPQEESESAPE